MINYIIATHGNLAEGFLSAIKLFAGEDYKIATIAGYLDDIPLETKFQKIWAEYESNDEIVVFTDIYGGSVNQFFYKKLLEGEKFHLITGVNLGLMIETIIKLKSPIDQHSIEEIIQQSKEQICYMNLLQNQDEE